MSDSENQRLLEDELEDFTAHSTRGEKTTKLDYYLWTKLNRSNRRNKLLRAIEITELAYFAKKMKPEAPINMDVVDVVFHVAQSLASAQIKRLNAASWHYKAELTWSFAPTKPNFERYISEWIQTYPHAWEEIVTNYPDITEPRKALICCKCGNTLINVAAADAEKIKTLIDQKYSDRISKEVSYRIDGDHLWLNQTRVRKSLSDEQQQLFFDNPLQFWTPPLKIVSFLKCPFCTSKIILETKYTTDSFPENRSFDATVSDIRAYTEKKLAGTKIVNDRLFVESQRWRQFFASCLFLRESGLQSLINSFVVWANPLVTEIEQEITKLISESAWKEIFKAGLKDNVEAEDHTSQMG